MFRLTFWSLLRFVQRCCGKKMLVYKPYCCPGEQRAVLGLFTKSGKKSVTHCMINHVFLMMKIFGLREKTLHEIGQIGRLLLNRLVGVCSVQH